MALKTCLKSIKEQQQGSRAQNGTGFPHVARLGVARGVRPAAASCAPPRHDARAARRVAACAPFVWPLASRPRCANCRLIAQTRVRVHGDGRRW